MIKIQFAKFLIVGSLTVGFDFLVYLSLISTAITNADIAKLLGFLSGTIFAYFANRFWTFKNQNEVAIVSSIWRFSLLYSLTLLVNVSVNSFFLVFLEGKIYQMQHAFLIATCLSASLNFLGMKYFIFKTKTKSSLL
jgi:putative flippase GtrA|tara:strand:+ start:18734 stop:19144 length:411 start_codon:yes stop_codon:yes gene_type:complete